MAKYPTPPGDSLEPVVQQFAEQRRQTRDLQRPGATAIGQVLQKIQDQQAYLSSLITRGITVPSFSSGPIPGDSTTRYVNAAGDGITLSHPTKRVLVTVGCERANLDPGNLSAEGSVSFNITREGETVPWYVSGPSRASVYSQGGRTLGVGVSAVVPVTVGAGTSTFRLAFGHWSSSTTTLASLNVSSPFMVIQVIDAL